CVRVRPRCYPYELPAAIGAGKYCLRKRAAHGVLNNECRPGRKKPRYSRESSFNPTTPPIGKASYFGNRVCRTIHGCKINLHHRLKRQIYNDHADLLYASKRRIKRRSCRKYWQKFRFASGTGTT